MVGGDGCTLDNITLRIRVHTNRSGGGGGEGFRTIRSKVPDHARPRRRAVRIVSAPRLTLGPLKGTVYYNYRYYYYYYYYYHYQILYTTTIEYYT